MKQKMARRKKERKRKIEQITIGVPKSIADDLRELPDMSRDVRYILEENYERLASGGVYEARQERKRRINELVKKSIKSHADSISQSIERQLSKSFSKQVEKIKELQDEMVSEIHESRERVNEHKKQLTKLEREAKKLFKPTERDTRKIKSIIKNELRKLVVDACKEANDELQKEEEL